VGNGNINSELYKNVPREFTWILLNFLKKVYMESTIPNEWREAIVIPIFRKRETKGTPKTRGINIVMCTPLMIGFLLSWLHTHS
jgi:hypothetical protein